MKQRMAKADAQGARAAIIIGDDEIAAGAAAVKSLADGTQRAVPFDALAEALR